MLDEKPEPRFDEDQNNAQPPTGDGEGPYPYGKTFKGEGTYHKAETTIGNCAIRKPIPEMYNDMIGVAIVRMAWTFYLVSCRCVSLYQNSTFVASFRCQELLADKFVEIV